MLGGRVDHEIRAQLKRPLQHRGAENIVDREQRARLLRYLGERRNIGDLGERIGRRLQEEELGVRLAGLLPFLGFHRRDKRRLYPEAPEDVAEELNGCAEDRG
jgi:hypothetical protein